MISRLFNSYFRRFSRIKKTDFFLFSTIFLLFCGQGVSAQSESDVGSGSIFLIENPSSSDRAEKVSFKVEADNLREKEAHGDFCRIIKLEIPGKQTPDQNKVKTEDAPVTRFTKFVENDFTATSVSRRMTAITPFKNDAEDSEKDKDDTDKDKDATMPLGGFQWRPAIEQSLLFLAVQHGYALTQPKTRSALKGEFFNDYVKSVKSLRGWGDGGRFFTNYIAHPMQGSFMGYIQIQNDPKGKRQRFGGSKDYWQSRMKALAWSAAWSTQFEIGPISQASIGNVGLSGKQTYVDLVVTPTLGTAMLITEDAIDRFLIERIESKTDNYYLMIFSRVLLNPTRTVANLIRFKLPWHRDRPRVR